MIFRPCIVLPRRCPSCSHELQSGEDVCSQCLDRAEAVRLSMLPLDQFEIGLVRRTPSGQEHEVFWPEYKRQNVAQVRLRDGNLYLGFDPACWVIGATVVFAGVEIFIEGRLRLWIPKSQFKVGGLEMAGVIVIGQELRLNVNLTVPTDQLRQSSTLIQTSGEDHRMIWYPRYWKGGPAT